MHGFEELYFSNSSFYHWYNTSTRQCNSDRSITSYSMNCNQFCYWTSIRNFNSTACLSITGATLLNLNPMKNVCRFNTRFLSSNTTETDDYWFNDGVKKRIYESTHFNHCIAKYCKIPQFVKLLAK